MMKQNGNGISLPQTVQRALLAGLLDADSNVVDCVADRGKPKIQSYRDDDCFDNHG
jgi:hypothetical protein